jgi:PAS domain S-box-containing protein
MEEKPIQHFQPTPEIFRLAVESAPSGMVMVDAEGTILLVNSLIEKMFGYSREELLGQSIDRLTPSNLQKKHPELRQQYLRNPQARPMGAGRDLYARRRDGTEFPVEIGLNPIQSPQGVIILSSIVDITERKRREDNFRLVVESAPSGMVMVNARGLIVLVNSLVEKMFGYSRAELLQQPIECLVPERFKANHPRLRNQYASHPETRAMGAGRDLFARRKDGSEFPVEIGLNPIDTPEGPMILSSIVDITARKHSEAELERLNQRLKTQNHELEAYTYAVSHDLRAPLRAIHNYADFLLEDFGSRISPEQQEYLTGLTTAVRESEELVSDLLELSRVDFHENGPHSCDLGEIVKKVLGGITVDQNVDIRTPHEWPTVRAQEDLLKQILQNLILNGLKFNRASPKRIELSWSREDNVFVRIAVRDNGIGIPPQYQQQIFQIFQRLHTTKEYEGTGIGLAIAKKAVQKLGGTIRVESQEGKGSIFSFTVPMGEAHEPT